MPSIPAATAIMQVEPDISGFSESLQKQLEEMESPVRTLLLNFSEWLDADEQMLKKPWCGGDARTHDELVTDFLEHRHALREAESDADDGDPVRAAHLDVALAQQNLYSVQHRMQRAHAEKDAEATS